MGKQVSCTRGAALALIAVLAPTAVRADKTGAAADNSGELARRARQAVERGLHFLSEDAAKWRNERNCATCHHGTMTVWALEQARLRGYAVSEETLSELTAWIRQRIQGIDKPRDDRPGWKMLNSPALYLSVMAQAMPGQRLLSDDEQRRIAGHLVRHQEADGAWAWSSAPPKNRPPPFFESDEVATLLGYVALGPQTPAGAPPASPFLESRHKAEMWLRGIVPSQTTQSRAFRLFRDLRDGNTAAAAEEAHALVSLQEADGGFRQVPGRASDAYATGQTVYFLLLAGMPGDRPEIVRAIDFLVRSQQQDGSWPMIPRAHPDATPSANVGPVIHLGSAWATLALARAVPGEPRASAGR